MEAQPAHRLVGEFGVHADHLGMLEALDEGQGMPDRREQDVATGLVGLGLHRESHVVAPLDDVGAEDVDRLCVAVEGGTDVLGRVGLAPLPPAPQHEHTRTELDAKVDGVEGLGHCVAAHGRVVGGERPLLEHGLVEEVGGDHRNPQSRLVERHPETLHDGLTLGRRRPERHQVVVMEVDSVCAQIGEVVDDIDGIERGSYLQPERIPAPVADRPESEGEAMFRKGRERIHAPKRRAVNARRAPEPGRTSPGPRRAGARSAPGRPAATPADPRLPRSEGWLCRPRSRS